MLLTEKNVSAAADKLNLSQSATSGALSRLRDYFGDELLIQVGRKMVLSPRAIDLSGKVRAALMQIDGTIIHSPGFDPAKVNRSVRIAASDYVTIVMLQHAIKEISRKAPGLKIIIEQPYGKPHESIERGEIDLLIMPEIYLSLEHPFEEIFSDGYVVVVWEGNTSYGQSITMAEYQAARHIAVQFERNQLSYEAAYIKTQGIERDIAAVAGSFGALPFLIVGTDFLSTMHRSLAGVYREMLPLRLIPSPIAIPELVECIQWHTYAAGDECLAWVRNQLRAAVPVEGR
ncbi:LysR family transcriptional regulator [Devosia sp. SL43]|uniref:LysR family transcriptional regulator n=1 Tax=Devosia sp. SL43 TaxID=2806348 RepID=UPI001F281B52|nr:LysR family transcriptional regulator [Devosia sp. SL43]UJW87455.1 LysR family transcriptional regulator [Devosia sp. SL43]